MDVEYPARAALKRKRARRRSAQLTAQTKLVGCWLLAGTWTGCTKQPASAAPEVAAASEAEQNGAVAPSLAQKYAGLFPIGAAVNSRTLHTHAALLARHFSSITAENEMKFESLEQTEGNFEYAAADEMVAFARTHGMKVRGHNLVWHRQTPDWVFSNGSAGAASKELLLARLDEHIANVVGHFKGSVYAWDVVNEAIMDDGKYRTADERAPDQRSKWYGILGSSYIAAAFRAAHAADPDAKLVLQRVPQLRARQAPGRL